MTDAASITRSAPPPARPAVALAFGPESSWSGVGAAMKCGRTGHAYVIIAPTDEALEQILSIRCEVPADRFTRERFARVKVITSNHPEIPASSL